MITPDVPLTETMFYILMTLHKPMHGYGITQEISALTKGRVQLGAGTLYGALKTMNERQWIQPVGPSAGPRNKKEYMITDAGRRIFEREVARLREALDNAGKLEEQT